MMSETAKLMNFDEFRASCAASVEAEPFAEAVRQQRDYLRDTTAAEALLRPGAIGAMGWIEWPDNVVPVVG
jgi:hypothetical protein